MNRPIINDNQAESLQGFRFLAPALSLVFFALVMLLPVGSGADGVLMPHLVLIAAFYWLSHKSYLLPFSALAGAGFLLDLWLGVPMGLNMLLLVLSRLFVLNQLKYYRGRTRGAYWLVFVALSAGLYALSWIVVSLVNWQIEAITPVILQWVLTAFAYGPIGFILGRLRVSAS